MRLLRLLLAFACLAGPVHAAQAIKNVTISGNSTITGNITANATVTGTLILPEAIRVPSAVGNSGSTLLSNGTTWTASTGGSLPSQTGNSGKFLTTNGTASSWATISGGGDVLITNNLSEFTATGNTALANLGLLDGSNKIKIAFIPTEDIEIVARKGTDAERQAVVFASGELVWTTDTKRLYVGDGSTSGGISATNNAAIGVATGTSLFLSSTTEATDNTGATGSLGTLGGLSVAKKGFFGGTIAVTGKAFLYDAAYVGGSLGVGVAENTQYGINVVSGSVMSARLVPTFGTQASGFGLYSAPTVSTGQTTTNLYHLGLLNASTSGATLTNQYGLYLTDFTAGTNNFAIYSGAGVVRFGDTTDASSADGLSGAVRSLGGLSVAKAGKFGGALSASNLSGTNTGDQTITLTGDITGSGTGSFATTLAAGSAAALNSGTLSAARLPALTGDITTSAGSAATTLATVNSNVGTYGSATAAAVVTVNGKGLVTAASNTTITPAVGSITGLGTGVATLLAGTPSGTGGLAGTTSPTFTTPALGAATGTTLFLSGTTEATNNSGTTGSLGTLGGLSVAKKGYFGGTLAVTGKAYFYDTAYVAGSLGVGVAENTQYGLNVVSGSVMSARLVPTFNTQASGFGIYSAPTVAAGQATTSLYHIGLLDAVASGATLTNQYGIYLTDFTAGTNNFAIYSGAGVVRFGDTTDASSTDGTTGAVRSLGGLSVAKSGRFGGVLVAGTAPTTITDSAGKVLSAALNTVAVAQGGTGLTAGTSGGVPYYSSTSALASSAALASGNIVIGGGAGAAPSTTTTASGITTWIGTPSSANLAAALTDEIGTGPAQFANIVYNRQTGTSYELVAGDAGKWVKMSNASANVLTVPDNATVTYSEGVSIIVSQGGAGATTISPKNGNVTINSRDAALKLYGQHSVAVLTLDTVSGNATTWNLSGDIKP